MHKYLYAYQNPTVWWDPTGNVAVIEEEIHSIMSAERGQPYVVSDSSILDIVQDKGWKVNYFFGQGYINPFDLDELKLIVQEGTGTAPGSQVNSNLGFVYVSKDDDVGSLKSDVRAILGSGKYLPQKMYEDAVERVLSQVGKEGSVTNLSAERSTVVANIDEAYRDNSVFNDAWVGRGFDSVWDDLVKTGDSGLPDDLWSRSASSTAWNFAPASYFSKGKYLKNIRGTREHFGAAGQKIRGKVNPSPNPENCAACVSAHMINKMEKRGSEDIMTADMVERKMQVKLGAGGLRLGEYEAVDFISRATNTTAKRYKYINSEAPIGHYSITARAKSDKSGHVMYARKLNDGRVYI